MALGFANAAFPHHPRGRARPRVDGSRMQWAVAFANAIRPMNVVRRPSFVPKDLIAPLNAVDSKAVGRRLFIARQVIAAVSLAPARMRAE